jgi:hypothetical protein
MYHVFSYGHRKLLASFDDENDAHKWTHEQAKAGGLALPISVEDLTNRTTRLIWPNRCRSIRWMALERSAPCELTPLSPYAVGSVR